MQRKKVVVGIGFLAVASIFAYFSLDNYLHGKRVEEGKEMVCHGCPCCEAPVYFEGSIFDVKVALVALATGMIFIVFGITSRSYFPQKRKLR